MGEGIVSAGIGAKLLFIGQVAAIAMTIVFIILALLMFFIKFQSLVINKATGKENSKDNKDENNKQVQIAESNTEAIVEDEITEVSNDEEIVAAIMAALSAYLDTPASGLNIKSIKRVNSVNSNWQRASIESSFNK